MILTVEKEVFEGQSFSSQFIVVQEEIVFCVLPDKSSEISHEVVLQLQENDEVLEILFFL